jgi:hypothetical protein
MIAMYPAAYASCVCCCCLQLLIRPAYEVPARLHPAYCPSLPALTDCRAALTLYAASQVLAVVLAAKGKKDEAADSLANSVKGAALVEAHCAVKFMQESLFPGRCLPGRRCVQQGAPLGGCTPTTRVCMHGLKTGGCCVCTCVVGLARSTTPCLELDECLKVSDDCSAQMRLPTSTCLPTLSYQ